MPAPPAYRRHDRHAARARQARRRAILLALGRRDVRDHRRRRLPSGRRLDGRREPGERDTAAARRRLPRAWRSRATGGCGWPRRSTRASSPRSDTTAPGKGRFPFEPVGRQANVGVATRVFHRIFGGTDSDGVVYYRLGGGQGPATGALDVGAAPGTDVYSPTDGTIVGLRDYVLNGKKYGAVIDIEPVGEPSVVLSVSHVQADPALTVGSTITASTSRIGRVVDLSGAERLALARYTRDAGNYVELTLHPAGSVPLR
jgi:hypothetical protein